MRSKIKGVISLEATIVIPIILVMSMAIVVLAAREVNRCLYIANAQKTISTAPNLRTCFLQVDDTYIFVPTISGQNRNENRYACKQMVMEGETNEED